MFAMKKFFQREDVSISWSILVNCMMAIFLFLIVIHPPGSILTDLTPKQLLDLTSEKNLISYTFYLFFISMVFVSNYIVRAVFRVFDLITYLWSQRENERCE